MRSLTVTLLQKLGYVTLEAGHVTEALSVLEGRTDVVLVLSDVVLPGSKNGVDLVAEAKGRWPYLKFLFMSGYTEGKVNHERLGFDVELLHKPFHGSALAAKVADAISGGVGQDGERDRS